jgi:transposase
MALADSAGRPLGIFIESGSRHDVALVEQTLDAAFTEHLPEKLIADRAFDSAPLSDRLARERGVELIAPNRNNTKTRRQDRRSLRRYKRRWKVERLFAWIKRFRRCAVRWERYAENYLGFLHLACALILLRGF